MEGIHCFAKDRMDKERRYGTEGRTLRRGRTKKVWNRRSQPRWGRTHSSTPSFTHSSTPSFTHSSIPSLGCIGCRYINHCIPFGDMDMPDYFDTIWDSDIK